MSTMIRRAIACLASLALGARMYLAFHDAGDGGGGASKLFVLATIAVPVIAAALVWIRRLPAQLLARGTWWSLLLGATLVACTVPEGQRFGAFVATACAVALIAAGRTGLESPRFAPVAFRGTLIVALVLAMADTGAYGWFGAGNAVYEHSWSVLMMVPPMIAAVIGLLRLRTWGLLVSVATNLAVVVLASTGALDLPTPIRQLFIASALLQLVIPLPMIVSIVRRRPPSPDAWQRTRTIVPIVAIAALATVSVYATYLHHGPLFRV
jgi:hypothetical protein